jgi:hypothetical protein
MIGSGICLCRTLARLVGPWSSVTAGTTEGQQPGTLLNPTAWFPAPSNVILEHLSCLFEYRENDRVQMEWLRTAGRLSLQVNVQAMEVVIWRVSAGRCLAVLGPTPTY